MSGDASVKAYAAMQDLTAIAPGPWTAFHPLQRGWSVAAPWSGAWARYHPIEHAVEISFYATPGATVADDTTIAVMPATDNDPRILDANGNVVGNRLRPPQVTRLTALSNAYQSTSPSSPRLHFNVNGEIRCYGIATAAAWVSCHDGARYSMYPM